MSGPDRAATAIAGDVRAGRTTARTETEAALARIAGWRACHRACNPHHLGDHHA